MTSGLMKLDWGNVPAWVGSILTGSSILIASLTYRRSVRDKREERLNQEREQASKVSAWIDQSQWRVFLQNANDAAVKARVYFEDPSQDWIAAYDEKSLGPDERFMAIMPTGPSPQWNSRPSAPALLIVDAAGAIWLRHSSGKLDRLNQQDRARLEKEWALHQREEKRWEFAAK